MIATCPAGTTVVGGGYTTGGDTPAADVHASDATFSGNGYRVWLVEQNLQTGSITVTVTAACASLTP